MKAKLLKSFNPWVLIFVGTAIFHAWRGSWQDLIIFGGAAILILSQVFGFYSLGFKQQPKFGVLPIALVVMSAAVILFLVPRHGTIAILSLVAFIPIGVALVMYQDRPVEQPGHLVLRSRMLWAWWAIIFALIELVAYVGSKLVGDLSRFPTISVILDPVLETPIGRAAFVALWLIAGVYLFGIRAKK